MSRAKLKPPVLTLDAAQEQAAQQVIKRFLQERFELELGSFEAQEVLDLFARKSRRCITTRRSSTCRAT